MSLSFINCYFSDFAGSQLITVLSRNRSQCLSSLKHNCMMYAFPTNIKFNNCKFINSYGSLVSLRNDKTCCKFYAYFNGPIYINGNGTAVAIQVLYISNMVVHINGPVIISNCRADSILFIYQCQIFLNGLILITLNNYGCYHVIQFQYCKITFNKSIIFSSNKCDNIITLKSKQELAYFTVMEHTNITFNNNVYQSLISVEVDENHNIPYPLCLFQYLGLTSATIVSPTHFTIIVTDSILISMNCTISVLHYLNNCKWLPSTVFSDYDPKVINRQIIQMDPKQLNQHTTICHCSNCSIDNLGTIYPGQTLQIELCMPCGSNNISVLYVETHNAFLPPSACKLAHQSQLITSIIGLSKVVNFTIVSDAISSCEIFLTASPFLYEFYEAFSIQLMPCPIGFTQQNGVCDCDPILPNDINTCYIDESAIRRPATTWITAREQSNNREYLVSHCSMDYCLPYSSNINLLNPDVQCQFNRTGVLCSQCQHPLSMVFGSSRCMKCDNFHLLISVIILIAGVSLVILLYLLNLTVTNGTVNGIVLYANIISINDSIFLANENIFKPLRVFISFVNLDLGIEICFYNGMDSYAKVWLQLLFPTYLIAIAVFIIIASRYSTRMLRLTFSRSLPVLATLFLLAYTGILRVTLTVLFSYSTITYLSSGDKQLVWSIDASVSLFGLKFIILFVICLLLLLLLVIFNITLLFTRSLSRVKLMNCLIPLLTTFQKSCKSKFYYWIAVCILLRYIILVMCTFQLKHISTLISLCLLMFTCYHGSIHPYKSKFVNIQEVLLLINLTVLYSVSYDVDCFTFTFVANAMISLAFAQFCTVILYHIFTYIYLPFQY